MKNGMHQNHIRIESVNARREYNVGRIGGGFVRPPCGVVQKKPAKKLQQMGAWNGPYAMKKYAAILGLSLCRARFDSYVTDPLCVQIDLIFMLRRKPFNQFRNGALRTMLAIHEWRDHCNSHVTRGIIVPFFWRASGCTPRCF